MADEKKTLKFQMMMSPQEAEILDDWMFENRVRSRAEAIRRLCQVGLSTANSWPPLSERIESAVDACHLAVRVFEEDYLQPEMQKMERSQVRRYVNLISRAYEALALLQAEKMDFRGEVVPFLDMGITVEDAKRASEEQRQIFLKKLEALKDAEERSE